MNLNHNQDSECVARSAELGRLDLKLHELSTAIQHVDKQVKDGQEVLSLG